MATIVERPMSVLGDAQTLPRQRRPSSVDVIDVDLLEDSPRPQPVIMLLDSDEEDGPSAATRQRLVSPPPPASAGPSRIPPVPRVPRNYSGLTGLPRRRRPVVPSPPVIRPIDQPFAFEANLQQEPVAGPSSPPRHPNRHRRIPQSELQAEPRSHHFPALGLGGALISLNRAQADARLQQRLEREAQLRNHAAAAEPGFFGRAGHALHRVFSLMSRSAVVDDEDDAHVRDLFGDDLGLRFDHPARAFAIREVLLRNPERQMEYAPEFTHPGKPDPGFVFDFAPSGPVLAAQSKPPIVIDLITSDDETPVTGPSGGGLPDSPSTKQSTLLVCAHCLDPLVLGAELTGEEGRKKKIWGLRCGHLIDGKCLDVLGSPQNAVGGVRDDPEDMDDSPDGPPLDYKGKGKARELEPSPIVHADNPIRSRLRSRAGAPSLPPPPTPPPPPSQPVSLGKRKRKCKSRVEETYEWKCPVGSCGRLHASVRLEETWVPEPDRNPTNGKGKGKARSGFENSDGTIVGRGAISVFV